MRFINTDKYELSGEVKTFPAVLQISFPLEMKSKAFDFTGNTASASISILSDKIIINIDLNDITYISEEKNSEKYNIRRYDSK